MASGAPVSRVPSAAQMPLSAPQPMPEFSDRRTGSFPVGAMVNKKLCAGRPKATRGFVPASSPPLTVMDGVLGPKTDTGLENDTAMERVSPAPPWDCGVHPGTAHATRPGAA